MEELVQKPTRGACAAADAENLVGLYAVDGEEQQLAGREKQHEPTGREELQFSKKDGKEEKRKRQEEKMKKLEEERRLREEAKRNKTNPTAQEVVLHRRIGSPVVTRVRSPVVNLLRSPLGALARATSLKRGMSSTVTMAVPPLAKRAKSRTSPWSESQRTPCYTMSFPSPVRSLEGIPSTARSPPPPDASRSTSSRAAPASTMASESVFSTGERVISDYRAGYQAILLRH